MMIRMHPQRLETGRLLSWLDTVLTAVLRRCDAVTVELVITDGPGRSSSVQITLRDVPGPLAGLQVRPSRGVRLDSPGSPGAASDWGADFGQRDDGQVGRRNV